MNLSSPVCLTDKMKAWEVPMDANITPEPSPVDKSDPVGVYDAPAMYPEVDGSDGDAIAVCGFSIKFPQDATSPHGFWRMMMEGRCAMTEFPPDRLNVDGFYRDKQRLNTLPMRGGHFVEDDLAVFDADFFSIAPTEAAAMDPMQRWLLEAAYRALENAGITMESISGSSTAVYTGSFSMDYMLQLTRDPECPPPYAAVGFGLSMLANRISWFFNLKGPSIGLDSACSSTAMAIDIACKSLRDGDCGMAMVAGCNLANSPEPYVWMSNVNFLSPDSRCHSFDHRANGYARGEGVGMVILKKVSDAIRDGNPIRAVIRSTGSNEDGRTPGITQPSREAQEHLIQETYRKAGLSMAYTRFFEAHGTGTPAGDPREAQAIGRAFQKYRSTEDPLYVGALKSNIGHLEGASGLAGLIKAVLVLEKGIIPPNANFEKVNPKIDSDFLKIKFPTSSVQWPSSGLRRASISSFGYGGSNSHIVLDDAYNYLRLRNLQGKHFTETTPPTPALPQSTTNASDLEEQSASPTTSPMLRLLVWSSADKNGIQRIGEQYQHANTMKDIRTASQREPSLCDLAYTLYNHKNHLQWRSFAVLSSTEDLAALPEQVSNPCRARATPPRIGFVFTGQGAQWFAMGRELIAYSSFKEELDDAGSFLKALGCSWSPADELLVSEGASRIDNPEFSQTLCTVLQVALVNLLHRFGIHPAAVVGHSSGEIAAAYAAGHLSRESAWKLAFFRGALSAELCEPTHLGPAGAMMAVGLSEADARELIMSVEHDAHTFGLSIACVNSPVNVTISGEEKLIDMLQLKLDSEKVFARKLRVRTAYHSRQMEEISSKYVSLVGTLSGNKSIHTVPMVSSVTGKVVSAIDTTDPTYWSLNMISTVRFSDAVTTLCSSSPADTVKKIDRSHLDVPVVDHLLEIGPHAALQGPIRDILRHSARGNSIGYDSALRRGQHAIESLLRTLGALHCLGSKLSFAAINYPRETAIAYPHMIADLPEYPFDHSQRYWHESRLSRNYRLREHAPSELIGVQSRDWNESDARWTHFIRTSEMPWTEQHVVNGITLYPGAGMLVMAIEAAKQLHTNDCCDGFTLQDVHLEGAMDLSASGGNLEVQISLRRLEDSKANEPRYDFSIRSYADGSWTTNCRGAIGVGVINGPDSWKSTVKTAQRCKIAQDLSHSISMCQQPVNYQHMYNYLKRSGYEFGPVFQAAREQRLNGPLGQATAQIRTYASSHEDCIVHPVSLDAALHLCFTSFTAGGMRPMATSVPSYIRSLWISSTGLTHREHVPVTSLMKITESNGRGFICDGGAISEEAEPKLRLWVEGLVLTNVTSLPRAAELPDPKQFCMNIEQMPAINKLDNTSLLSYLDELHPVTEDLTLFFEDIGHLIKMTLEKLMGAIDTSSLHAKDTWKERYLNWVQHQLTEGQLRDIPPAARSFEDLCDDLAIANNVGRLYVTVARHIEALLKDEVTPLDLLMQTGLLRNYYEDLAGYRCMLQAASYTNLLAHQNPGMKILEIGGGTASATRGLIHALSSDPFGNAGRTLRCERYDFTDVSSAFLENARESFALYHDQMTFGILNIEQDFSTQGYGEGEYDLVVADGVLHITADLDQTLTNVRKALKPGGKLVMPELLKSDGWTAGFVFGVFPGWWLGSVDDHPLSPNLSADDWGAVLKSNGFTGSELVLTDFDGPAHHLGCIISTALAESPSSSVSRQRPSFSSTIIVDKENIEQMHLADHILPKLSEAFGRQSDVLTLEEAVCFDKRSPADFNILLLDYDSFFLSSLDEFAWVRFQTLVESARHILWISSGGGKTPLPAHGMIDGLARTLRSEYYELHLVTMALDPRSGYGQHVSHLAQIVDEMLRRTALEAYEQEYVEIEGRLHTRRLIEADYLKSDMEAQLMPYKIVSKPLGQVRFQTSTEGLAGLEVDPFFVECNSTPTPLENDDVDILVRAVPLQDQNRSRDTIQHYGNACAGVVASVGPRSALRPGDRVFAIVSSSLRSEVRVSSQKVLTLPENISYSEAASVLPNLLIAYHALIEIGQTCQDDTIFVHDGYSALGRAAIDLLTKRGKYNIWTTADNEEQSTWIVQNLGIPSENVIPNGWFDSEPMLVSHLKRTFDVVISSQDEFETPSLIDCVRMGARYLKIHQEGGPSTSNRQAVSLPPISMSIIRFTTHVPTSEALQYASAQIKTSLLKLSEDQASVFPASELTNALHHLRYTTSGTTVVIELNDSDVISVRMSKDENYRMHPDATYVIAGGLGGLGRAMARWLASRGARYLILLSRSGMRTAEAHELSTMLREQGVHCEMPACSVADRDSLKSVLFDCATRLPPIKGCIQSSMIMTEKIFQQMSFADWEETLKAKVDGSWNLHEELPHDLDFFVLISSMMGIMGSGSLAAYNASNTYQDTLAHYRVSIGQRAVSLNLGAVPDGGYLVSNADHVAARQHVLQAEKYALTHVKDLCALLHMFCRPEHGLSSHDIGCQAVVGIRPPSHWKHVEEVPFVFGQPFWGHMHHMPLPPDLSDTILLSQNSAKKPARDVVENLVAAGSLTEAAAIVSEALAQRVSSLLGVTEDRLDTQKPMHSYGLDSLSSIEIRNWIGQAFNVDLPVFMILGGATFSSAAETIVSKI